MNDPHRHLLRALEQDGLVVDAGARPWASATFVGARHSVRLAVSASLADACAAALADREFALPGHLVADLVVLARTPAGDRVLLDLEVLVLEAH